MNREEQARDDVKFLLALSLQAAVPLLLDELAHVPDRALTIRTWAEQAADEVGSRGDILQWRSSKRGETASVFNHLARGMAALATAPGGVRFLGLIFCSRHSPGGRAAGEDYLCPRCNDDPGGVGADASQLEQHLLVHPRRTISDAVLRDGLL